MKLVRRYNHEGHDNQSDQGSAGKAHFPGNHSFHSISFESIHSINSCGPTLFIWSWRGPANLSMSLMITTPNRNTTITLSDHLSPDSQSFLWDKADVPQGWYMLMANVSHRMAESEPFYILTDPVCSEQGATVSTATQTLSSSITPAIVNAGSTPTSTPLSTTAASSASAESGSGSSVANTAAIALGTVGGVTFLATIIILLYIRFGKGIRLRTTDTSSFSIDRRTVPSFQAGEEPESPPVTRRVNGPDRQAPNHISATSAIYYYAENASLSIPSEPPPVRSPISTFSSSSTVAEGQKSFHAL